MRNRNYCLLAAALLCTLLNSGCLDEQVRTIISANGSIQRVISMKLGSKTVPDNAFPVPTGDGWSVEWKETGDTTGKFLYTARKTFPAPAEFQNEYVSSTRSGLIGIDPSVEKRFRWFFTYFDYNETFSYRNPHGFVPVSKFLTPDEIAQFQRQEKDSALNEKVELWEISDDFEDTYAMLVAEAGHRSDSATLVPLLVSKKEEAYRRVVMDELTKNSEQKDEATRPRNTKKFTSSKKNGGDLDEQNEKILAEVFGKEFSNTLRPAFDSAMERTTRKDSQQKFPENWEFTAEMPGLLLDANGLSVQGNAVTWKFNPTKVKVANYVMHASSRVVNIWAFVATGIAGLVLILLSLRSAFRRRS